MARKVSDLRDELADREAIRDTLMRYCRASDRADEAMLRSVYWPDARDNHLEFSGNTDQFVDYCMPILRAMRFNMHMVGNVLICIDGNRAEVESYFRGYHSIPDESGHRRDSFAGGRYLDTFEKRDDEWRILKRFVTVDWFRDYPDTGDWERGPFDMGRKVTRGDIKPEDISYRLVPLLD